MGAGLSIPFALTPAVALEQRYAHMEAAIRRQLPRLEPVPIDDTRTLHVACYGPSLHDTWRELGRPLVSMSGATKWLAARGVMPDYHVDMDPRANKVMTSLPPVPRVHYLVASICCPEYFDALAQAGVQVTLWHTVSSNWDQDTRWVSVRDPNALVVSGGSTIGLAALQLGGVLGFRRFEIHGMDASFADDGERHAGPHAGKSQKADQVWPAAGKTYRTSRIMANAAAEAVNTCRVMPILCTFHGDGLTQALIREANLDNACCADETEKRTRLASQRVEIAALPPLPKGGNFWVGLMDFLEATDLPELVATVARCEPRRRRARFNTGSISLDQAVQLRALCRFYRPEIVVEIGTFIGTSTEALLATRAIFTCDKDNDCVPATDVIVPHPGLTSTDMLRQLTQPVDLFFFDGRLQMADLPHIQRLSRPGTVYAFDDYTGAEKGVINVAMVGQLVPDHILVTPHRTTLAALVPRRR